MKMGVDITSSGDCRMILIIKEPRFATDDLYLRIPTYSHPTYWTLLGKMKRISQYPSIFNPIEGWTSQRFTSSTHPAIREFLLPTALLLSVRWHHHTYILLSVLSFAGGGDSINEPGG